MCAGLANASQEEHLAFLRRVYNFANEAVLILDPAGRVVEQNGAHARLFGYRSEHLVGGAPPHLDEEVLSQLLVSVRAYGNGRAECQGLRSTGESLDLAVSAFLVDCEGGEDVLIFVIRDNTELHKLEQRYYQAITRDRPSAGQPKLHTLARQLASSLPVEEAFVITLVDGEEKTFWSKPASYQRQALQGEHLEQLSARSEVLHAAPRTLAVAVRDLSGEMIGAVGVRYDGEVEHPKQGAAILQLFAERISTELESARNDETLRQLSMALEEANGELRRLFNVDPLTGLTNQKGFRKFLESERDGEGRVSQASVIYADCDDFRRVNDVYGSAMGDLVLKEVAKRLEAASRPQDLVARVGGDEFLVFLPETEQERAQVLAERIRLAISSEAFLVAEEPLHLSLSIGVTSLPERFSTLEEILALTERGLKHSKSRGKNRVSSSELMAVSAKGLATSYASLGEVLLGESGICALSQAIIRVDDEREVAWEMLCRGPQGPFESPKDFFRFSQENNILTAVDLRCLQTCIAFSEGLRERIHINLFPSTILATPPSLLVQFFAQDPGRYVLEINEQQSLCDPNALRPHVMALKKAGVSVALDDVGFGRSSLEALLLLEPDVVKIDRSCVHGVADDPDRARLLSRLVKVVNSLEAKLVAEGIEYRRDFERIRDAGIPYAQGYLWGRPAKVERKHR